MKVLQVSNYFPPSVGGIEVLAYDCTQALEGCEQKVFCFNHVIGEGDRTDVVNGTEIVRAGCFAKVASQSLSASYGKLLKRTFRDFAPDVVIFHYPNPFAAHYLIKLLKKYPQCKFVLWWHLDITKQKFLGKFFKGQTRRLIARAKVIVATSPNYIEGSSFLREAKKKCVVIPSCVSDSRMDMPESVKEQAAKYREENKGKTICFAVGRHVPYKGMEYLVRASKFLGDDFAVWIGGSGPLTQKLKKSAAGDGKISFLGRISDDELKSRMLACDIFCFPSITKNEAFGLALAEAMACAKPAVTFTIKGSGVNYVSLNGVTGIEVANGDAAAYAGAIKKLAADGQLRKQYGDAARQRVMQNFTFGQFRENVAALMRKVAE